MGIGRSNGGWSDRYHRLTGLLNRSLAIGLAVVACVSVFSLVAPILLHYDAAHISSADSLAPPSLRHWFGADDLGRDVLVRVAVGYTISLTVAIGSVLLALAIGIPLGLAAGYAGELTDNLIMRPLDVLMAFPGILLAVIVIAVFGTGTTILMLAIGVIYIPIIARVMRASTLVARRELYVQAALARGASHLRIASLHVLPNSIGPVIVQASILMGIAILLEAAFSFLGLGVRPPTPSLGLMLSAGRDFMVQSPWMVIAPGLAIMVVVLGFNLIGDGLRDRLDPRGTAQLR